MADHKNPSNSKKEVRDRSVQEMDDKEQFLIDHRWRRAECWSPWCWYHLDYPNAFFRLKDAFDTARNTRKGGHA